MLECFGRDRDRIGIRRAPRSDRYEATRLLDAFEGRSIHHEVPEDWKGLGTPRFNRDLVTVIEMAHMELANGAAFLMAVSDPVDHKAAGATDAFATIVLERDRILVLVDQILIENIEHLEKRHMVADIVELIGLKAALVVRFLLPPNMQRQLHL